MAYDTVYLKGRFANLSGSPMGGYVAITVDTPTLVDDAGDLVLAGADAIRLDEDGSFRVELPAESPGLTPPTFNYTLTPVRIGPPRKELEPVSFTLLVSEATEVTEDDGEGGAVTFYEKDISDFMA